MVTGWGSGHIAAGYGFGTQIGTGRDGTSQYSAVRPIGWARGNVQKAGLSGTEEYGEGRALSVFETAPFDHSGTSPDRARWRKLRPANRVNH